MKYLLYSAFDFRGRISTPKYIIAIFTIPFLATIPFIVPLVLYFWIYPKNGTHFILILTVILLISAICISIKRLHDLNKTGWYLMIYFGGAVLLNKFSEYIQEYHSITLILKFIAGALLLWGAFELILSKGDKGNNRFGSQP